MTPLDAGSNALAADAAEEALIATLQPGNAGWLEAVRADGEVFVGRTFGGVDPAWRARPLGELPRGRLAGGRTAGGGLVLGAADLDAVAAATRALAPPADRAAQWVLGADGRLRWGTEPLPGPVPAALTDHRRVVLGPWHVLIRRLSPGPLWLLDGRPTTPVPPALLRLTPAQARVAERIAEGDTVEQAARHLGRGVETVRTHLRAVYRLLGVSHRVELATALGKLPGGAGA